MHQQFSSLLKSHTPRILIESHRGSQGFAPENSWPALEIGLTRGADLLEVDVQISRDGVPFIRHPYNLPDGRPGWTVDWAEIAGLRVENQPIPCLSDVLEWAASAGAMLSLDLKNAFIDEDAVPQAVAAVLRRHNAAKRVLAIAWDHLALRRMKAGMPGLRTRALIRGRTADLPGLLRAAECDAISLSFDLTRRADVEQAHALGVAVWLVDFWPPPRFDIAVELGADAVSWGDPLEARHALEQLDAA